MADCNEEGCDTIQRGHLLLSSGYLVPTLGLLVVQVIYGSSSVLIGTILISGVDPLFYIIVNNLAIFIFIFPLAALYERHKWPKLLVAKLGVQVVLMSLGGVMVFQVLGLLGMQKTSPTITVAMSNLSPGLIFLIACCLRFEKFDRNCRYSACKAMGTLLGLGGVIAMTLLQNNNNNADVFGSGTSQEWVSGCVYILLGVFVVSCTTMLQATVLENLSAPLSLTAITSLLGATFTALVQLLWEGQLHPGKYTIGTALLVSYVGLISVLTSMCIAFQMWCIHKQGPVFMAMFYPIGTVTSAVLSAMVLGNFLSVGSLAGVFVVILGLYTVLWAKRKEHHLTILVNIQHAEFVDNGYEINGDGLKKSLLSER